MASGATAAAGIDYVPLDPGEGVEYRVYVNSTKYGESSPTIKAPSGGLKEGSWVSTTGAVQSQPC